MIPDTLPQQWLIRFRSIDASSAFLRVTVTVAGRRRNAPRVNLNIAPQARLFFMGRGASAATMAGVRGSSGPVLRARGPQTVLVKRYVPKIRHVT